MNQTKIRPATAADRAGWAVMREELWPDCPRERHKLEVEHLLASNALVVVAEVDGKLAGFAELSIRNDHVEGTNETPIPYLEGWYVREAYRGKGVGRSLMAFAERWALEQGFQELASDAEIENEPSIQLHKQLGFREVGRSVHFVKTLR